MWVKLWLAYVACGPFQLWFSTGVSSVFWSQRCPVDSLDGECWRSWRRFQADGGNAATTEAALMPNGESLTVTQAAQLGLVYRLARRKWHSANGLDINHWIDPDPWNPSAGNASSSSMAPPAAPSNPTVGERKMKFASVLDQADETEFQIAPESQRQAWLEVFIRKVGGLPQEAEEPTVEQLSALNRRINSGGTPFADFGVWLPFGRKAMKAHRYRTFLPSPEGGCIMREMPGPASFSQWQASYRVYRTALLMLDVIAMSTLVSYESLIERFSKLYPGAWHLVVEADNLARGEHLMRLKVITAMEISGGAAPPERWDPDAPWESMFRKLLKDHHFWAEQIHVPANAWLSHGSRRKPMTPAESIANGAMRGGRDAIRAETEDPKEPGTSSPARRTRNQNRRDNKRKRHQQDQEELQKFRKGGGKGKNSKGKEKTQLCYAWNNNNGACAGLPPGAACQGRVAREHRCTKCNSPGHPSHSCTSGTQAS